IGQEAIGDNHTDAQGTAIVRINGASDLGTGEYLMWGHDGAGLTGTSSELPGSFGGLGLKLTREWRADETGGDVGTVSIIFDTDSISPELGPSASQYRLLTDADGNFTNATVIMPSTWGTTITFDNVDLSTESFFTLANTGIQETCVSILGNVSASWSTTGEWSCGTFPDSSANAEVVATHIRIVSDTQSVNDLDINAGASVVLSVNATLIIKGNLTISNTGSLICNSGSNVIFRGNEGNIQLVNNSSGGNQAFANVQITNPDNVLFFGGTYSISEGLHLIDGSFQNSSGLTFTSDASSQGHVARVIAGDFTGSSSSFTIERFKAGGASGWNDLATAGIATTIADIENEIYISGVTGAGGNAGGFISMYTYDNVADDYTPATNVTNPMGLGQGFETWLGDDLTTWNAKAWNFTGSSMNIASTDITVDPSGSRWNLVGNPLPSFIDFSSVLASFAGVINGNEFWYFDTDSNQYNSRGAGAFIPPGQGFWVNLSGATTLTIDPATDIFSDRNTSEWFKNAPKEEFKVKVTNQENSFASSVYLRKDYMAFSGVDELDLQPLKVPDSRAVNMWMDYAGEESMVNYIDPTEEHLEVPLTIESGIPGEFIMNFQGLNKFDEFQCKNLLNLETNEQIEIVPGASYSFEVGEDLDPLNFKLLLSKSDYEDCLAPTEFTNNDIRVFSNGKTIVADFFLDRSVEAKIEVYNMLGQTVYGNTSTIGYSRESINLTNVKTGVFFVNININGTNKTEKVILK
ncbi:T9SS type A sorting domain-containing protein, partial [Salibacteraceae bacterium]|nr:T9SS type A sorting domain-containing protein [Salibacteraceae bacterium]